MAEIDRRDWLTRAGTLVGGLGLSLVVPDSVPPSWGQEDPAPQDPSSPRPPRKKAVRLGMLAEDLPFHEKFQLLKDLGFDGVEVENPLPADHPLTGTEVLALRQKLKSASEETGLEIHGVVNALNWKHPFSHPDFLARRRAFSALADAIASAKFYGATTVRQLPGVVNKSIRYDDAYLRSLEEIHKLLPLAEGAEIVIAFENARSQFLLSPLEFGRYLEDFGSDAVAVCLNIGNVVSIGWPEHWIRALAGRIAKVQLSEYSRQKAEDEGQQKAFDIPLMEGTTDWPAVMNALREVGFSGWYTADVPGGGAERMLDISRRMDRILAG